MDASQPPGGANHKPPWARSGPIALPLRIGPNDRHLVDQAGHPVLIQGDAAWSLIVALSLPDAVRYLDGIAMKGFNAIIVNLIESHFAPDPPRNALGQEPFQNPGDLRHPNDAYMQHAHDVLREAEARGIVTFLVPTYLGYPVPHMSHGAAYGYDRSEGWYGDVVDAGVEVCREFGRYIGERFADLASLIWTIGGDRNPDGVLEHMNAIAAGITETYGRSLFGAHGLPETFPFDVYPDSPWLSLDFTYTYQLVHNALMQHYLRIPPRPNILIESTYERDGNHASDQQIRRQAYWAILSGAAGQFIGSYGVWDFAADWAELLDSPARQAQAHLARLFAEYPWWELVPDLSRASAYTGVVVGHAWRDDSLREFVVDGVGELRGMNFASAARTPDGRLAMVYLPESRPITVDLTQMEGKIRARWFNPVDGSSVDAGTYSNEAPRALQTPFPTDSVLILDAS